MNHFEHFLNLHRMVKHNMLLAPTGNLGISRQEMPQIESKYREQFIQWLKNKGIKVKRVRVMLNTLKLTQAEYNKDKVLNIIDQLKDKDKVFDPIFVSKDGMVLDGSHRLLALLNSDNPPRMILVDEIQMDVLPLLKVVHEYPHVKYRSVSDKPIKKYPK